MTDDTTTRGAAPALSVLVPRYWQDYELLDSGNETKLERFGPYRVVRPESAAIWQKALPESQWLAADAVFDPGGEAGKWQYRREVAARWKMRYQGPSLGQQTGPKPGGPQTGGPQTGLQFWAQLTPFRHVGVFPEQASQWEWIGELVGGAKRPVKVLNLFGYTGLATLAAAAAGASVTHVDASKKSLEWARENQSLSGLEDHPIRWLLDDAMKFARREIRRGAAYDGILLDPPKFGRGPKGEVWKAEDSLLALMETCRQLLSDRPLFLILTTYATRISALSLRYLMETAVEGRAGTIEAGELAVTERSAGRLMSTAVFARWRS